jgi:hypothetical protein
MVPILHILFRFLQTEPVYDRLITTDRSGGDFIPLICNSDAQHLM